MDTVFCECKKCDAPIGRFINLWTQIGNSYFSPVVEPEDDLATQCKGAVRVGESGTLVEECHLQDVVCSNCAALLGLKCIQTPVNHVLAENQLLLRLASVELLDSDGRDIDFAIKRVLSVNESSKVSNTKFPDPAKGTGFSSTFPGAIELQQLQIELHNQREDIKRIDSNGFRIVSALDKRADRIEGEVTKLKGALGGAPRDIGELQHELGSIKAEIGRVKISAQDTSALVKLEGRLATASNKLGDVGQQVTTLDNQFQREIGELKLGLNRQQQDVENLKSEVRDSVTVAEYARDMASLRAEIAHLRQQLNETRAHEVGRAETAFPRRELEVLTSNIAKLGNRASQVETLHMELEILKGRVERTEAKRRPVEDRRPIGGIDAGDLVGYSDIFPSGHKRAASASIHPHLKRPALSTRPSDFSDRRYATPPFWLTNPTTTADHDEAPGYDITTPMTNTAKRRKKSPQSRTAGAPTGISGRLRNR